MPSWKFGNSAVSCPSSAPVFPGSFQHRVYRCFCRDRPKATLFAVVGMAHLLPSEIPEAVELCRLVRRSDNPGIAVGKLTGFSFLSADRQGFFPSCLIGLGKIGDLLRSGRHGLSRFMRRFFTGYAIRYNLRYERRGRLYQDRYKSIVCDEDT